MRFQTKNTPQWGMNEWEIWNKRGNYCKFFLAVIKKFISPLYNYKLVSRNNVQSIFSHIIIYLILLIFFFSFYAFKQKHFHCLLLLKKNQQKLRALWFALQFLHLRVSTLAKITVFKIWTLFWKFASLILPQAALVPVPKWSCASGAVLPIEVGYNEWEVYSGKVYNEC